MPNIDPVKIPSDAFDKADAKAKDVDFYADLTDEERAEEGLPPREAPKAAEPAKSEKPAAEKEPEPEPAKVEKAGPGDEDEDEDEEYDERLFREIASLREDLSASLEKKETAPKVEATKDPLIEAALTHEDPVVRGLAERLQQAEQALTAQQAEARESRIASQIAKDDAEFDTVQASYLVEGRAMTDKQVEQMEDWILANPTAGAALTIEQVARVVFPGATKRQRAASSVKAPAANGDGPAVATIVDQGAGSGGTTSGAFKPRANETIESAIQEAGKRFGWKR